MSSQRTDSTAVMPAGSFDLLDLPTASPGPRPWRIWAVLVPCLVAATPLVVAAYSNARHSTSQTHFAVFWAGFILGLGATGWAGARTRSRVVRTVILLAYAGFTFLPKLLMSWNGPVYYDEFGQLRHVQDVLATGNLGAHNAFLPIVQWYPGLAVVTSAVHEVAHLGVWHAGQVVVGLSRAVALICVWRLAVALGLSDRRGFFAALIFSLNPSFLYFDSQFAYESLGLPLAITALTFAALARRSESRGRALGWTIAATIAAAAVVPTHHLSAAMSAVMLLALTVFVPARRGRPAGLVAEIGPWISASVAVVGIVVWATWIAPATVDYLKPHLDGALTQLGDLVKRRAGQSAGSAVQHTPFSANDVPAYEVICAYVTQVLVGVMAVAVTIRAWRERSNPQRSLMFVPSLLLVTLYFATLPLSLTAMGGEPAHRIWPFTYVGVALVISAGVTSMPRTSWRPARPVMTGLAAVATVVMAIGNVAVGSNALYRFPGPTVFGTDSRSQTPELRSLARWSREHLPPDAKVVTDRFTGEVLTADTKLIVQSPYESYSTVLYREGDAASSNLRSYLASHHFQYWIIDERIVSQDPIQRFFQGYVGRQSISVQAIETVGMAPGSFLTLVYASPNYRIYAMTP